MATEAKPKETSERYIQRQVVIRLRKDKWFTQIASSSTRAGKGLAGHPDIIATKVNKSGIAIILYVECKAKGAKLRPSQEKWMKRAESLLKAHNVYFILAEATLFREFEVVYETWNEYAEEKVAAVVSVLASKQSE